MGFGVHRASVIEALSRTLGPDGAEELFQLVGLPPTEAPSRYVKAGDQLEQLVASAEAHGLEAKLLEAATRQVPRDRELKQVADDVVAALTRRYGSDPTPITRALRRLLVHHPLRRASEICRQREVGIDESPIADRHGKDGQWPPYVARDIDDELDRVLRESPFVVLTGASKEGKSRTLFEAVRRMAEDPYVAVLRPGQPLEELLELSPDWPRDGPVIVWLDKIDLQVGGGGLTSLAHTDAEAAGLKLVGTIESDRLNEILNPAQQDGERAELVDELRDAAETLRWADRVELPVANPRELERAQKEYRGEAFERGIGQYFAGAAKLQAWYAGAPRAHSAVARAVVDWQRTGSSQRITRATLERLAMEYLEGADPERSIEPGIEWATTTLPSEHILVRVDPVDTPPRYWTPDHIVEFVDHREGRDVTSAAWVLATEEASGRDALAIGLRAADKGALEHAKRALEKARTELKHSGSMWRTATVRLAGVMRRLDDDDAAVALYEQAIAAGSLIARNNYGYMLLTAKADPGGAERVLVPAVTAGNRTAPFNLLAALAAQGALERAAPNFLPGVEAGNLAAALNLGMIEHARGELELAEQRYRIAERGSGPKDARFARRAGMMRAILAGQQGRTGEAAALWRENWSAAEWKRIVERLEQLRFEGWEAVVERLGGTGRSRDDDE